MTGNKWKLLLVSLVILTGIFFFIFVDFLPKADVASSGENTVKVPYPKTPIISKPLKKIKKIINKVKPVKKTINRPKGTFGDVSDIGIVIPVYADNELNEKKTDSSKLISSWLEKLEKALDLAMDVPQDMTVYFPTNVRMATIYKQAPAIKHKIENADVQIIDHPLYNTTMKGHLARGNPFKGLGESIERVFVVDVETCKDITLYIHKKSIKEVQSIKEHHLLIFSSDVDEEDNYERVKRADLSVFGADRKNSRVPLALFRNNMEMMAMPAIVREYTPLDAFSFMFHPKVKDQIKPIWISCGESQSQNIQTSLVAPKHIDYITYHGEQNGLVDFDGNPVDYFIAIKTVGCTAKQTIEHLNEHTFPHRIIYAVVFPKDCPYLVSLAPNVRCGWEQHLVPNWGKKYIEEATKDAMIQKRAGWYFLQTMNFFVGQYASISNNYVVWDADAVPLISMDLFPKGKTRFYVGDNHDYPTMRGYHRSYRWLTKYQAIDPTSSVENPSPEDCDNGKCTYDPSSHHTWVAHFMVMNKFIVRDIIERMREIHNLKKPFEKPDWYHKIVESVEQHPEDRVRRVGYGEYDVYGSWMARFHTDKYVVDLDSWKTCSRPTTSPRGYKGDCCIPQSFLDEQKSRDMHYVVREFERGTCDATDSKHEF